MLEGVDLGVSDAGAQILAALREYAVECSILKVVGTESLDWIVDEAVQIFGGYGFSSEYEVERAYRDQRVNRIFEGTNEINRLLITDMLLKRSMKGELGLIPAAQKLLDEVLSSLLRRSAGRRGAAGRCGGDAGRRKKGGAAGCRKRRAEIPEGAG